MHGVPAVLSVWAAAIGWLALAKATGRPTMLFPYSIVFGAHLAMFGISRLAHQFPERPLASLFWRAVVIELGDHDGAVCRRRRRDRSEPRGRRGGDRA